MLIMTMTMREINLCTNCADTITNPLCPYCFSQHVLLWLRDKNLSDKQVKLVLMRLKDFIRESEVTPSDINCIICGREEVKVCTFCSMRKASEIIEKIAGQDASEMFDEDFNVGTWKNNWRRVD